MSAFGPKRTSRHVRCDVCYWENSGHDPRARECRLMTRSRHVHAPRASSYYLCGPPERPCFRVPIARFQSLGIVADTQAAGVHARQNRPVALSSVAKRWLPAKSNLVVEMEVQRRVSVFRLRTHAIGIAAQHEACQLASTVIGFDDFLG